MSPCNTGAYYCWWAADSLRIELDSPDPRSDYISRDYAFLSTLEKREDVKPYLHLWKDTAKRAREFLELSDISDKLN